MADNLTPREQQLIEALQPFAGYADPRGLAPRDMQISAGSLIARRQLTMGDCYDAAAAIARASTGTA